MGTTLEGRRCCCCCFRFPPVSCASPKSCPSSSMRRGRGGSSSGGQGDGPGYVTPLVRKLAGQHGVDLNTVTGTGVGGRIRKQDVLEAAKAKEEPAAPAASSAPSSSAPAASSGGAPAPTSPSPLRGPMRCFIFYHIIPFNMLIYIIVYIVETP
ncbi:MAG TPA: hypothetical protein EYQ24_02635, partial [Bacteroidetes bacterium]|nr:hypothetical protein [Bacteroidota bacterium]